MSNFYINNTQLQTQLAQKYFNLSPAVQRIIQLFSVIYAPVEKKSFISCLSKMNAVDDKNRPWTTNTVSYQIEKLVIAVLLVKEDKKGIKCHPLLTEIATRHAVATGQFEILVQLVEETFPIRTHWSKEGRVFHNLRQCIREIRIGIYRHDLNFINKQIEDYQKHSYSYSEEKLSIADITEQIFNNPFDAEWFNTLPQELYETYIANILVNSTLKLFNAEDAFALLEEECTTSGKHATDFTYLTRISHKRKK